jgi:hypothetical protein
LPRDCCAAHAHKPKPAPAAPAPATSATCAMHHDAPQPEPAGEAECSLRGACRGPLAALNSFFSAHGVLPESESVAPDARAAILPGLTSESTVSQAISPDPPPPRV